MKRCRTWRNRIPEAIYDELDARTREKMERHLAACEGCAGLYERMAAAVLKMEARPAPDRPPQFWEGYGDRLEARMALEPEAPEGAGAGRKTASAGEPRRPRRVLPIPAWASSVAGAILFISLGVFIGRTVLRPRQEGPSLARTTPSVIAPTEQAALETGSAEPPFAVQASRYLKRSRVLLLAVVNSAPQDEDPFRLNRPLQKKASEELLREAAVLKKGLGSSDRRLERLISDLEMILLQIANLAADADDSDIEIIRAGVESRDILFKINLSEAQRPSRKPSAGQAPGPWGGNGDPAKVRTAAEA
jgi:Putative zinc-finger